MERERESYHDNYNQNHYHLLQTLREEEKSELGLEGYDSITKANPNSSISIPKIKNLETPNPNPNPNPSTNPDAKPNSNPTPNPNPNPYPNPLPHGTTHLPTPSARQVSLGLRQA